MKTAIYIEDGIEQIVLTPENDFEKNILHSLSQKDREVKIYEGAFYDCRGGWVRQNNYYGPAPGGSSNDSSLIITCKKMTAKELV